LGECTATFTSTNVSDPDLTEEFRASKFIEFNTGNVRKVKLKRKSFLSSNLFFFFLGALPELDMDPPTTNAVPKHVV
jgi:hypothetical protein